LGSMAAAVVLLVGRVGEPAVGTDYPLAVAVGLIMLLVIAVALVTVQICTWLWRLAALSDPLTSVLNRRGFDYYLVRSAGTCPSSRMYVATVDLDRFKAVNDTLGHSIGDQVLQRTAAILRDVAGPDAVVARTGGEEFAVAGWLVEESGAHVGERLRAAVATMPGLPARVTASIGVVITQASAVADRSDRRYVLHRSDAAMYEAKRLGGNTFVVVDRGGTGLRSVCWNVRPGVS
ncbi:GGDEF domain-containing protein, partial [Nocardia gipuzkoensis]